MTRLLLASVPSITVIVLCTLLLTGCSSLLIHDDDNIAVVAGKVAVRTVNCALTIFGFCMSEWWFMQDAYNSTLVWYGNGDINGDNYKCQQEASSSSSGATGYIHMPVGANVMSIPMDSGGGRQINQQLYHSCMRARGYTLHDGYELNRWRENQANVSVSTTQSEQDANAQFNRGAMYHLGQGVTQDYAQARQWYEKAVAQGNANAQANLGTLYLNGQGVPQDYALARQWYAKAIAQGNADAQFYLGWMYAYGQGIPQDLVQAYLWLSVAAAQNNKVAAQERDKIVIKMTPAQLADAQRLTQQCQARQFKAC